MRPIWIAAALCAFFVAPLDAQGVSSTKERIRKDVEEKQRQMREGKVVRSNVRIMVRLHNGSRIKGVVKNGRFIERHDGLAFVASERTVEGAGLRLWYYDQTNSYIFLPWRSIQGHTIGEVLTDEEVKTMGLDLERNARRARDDARALAGKGAPKPVAEKGGGAIAGLPGVVGPKPAAGEAPESALTDEQKALLAEFPPEQGWGLDKMKKLELRKVQVGVFPNESEKRFLDNFAAWNVAYELRRTEDAQRARVSGSTPVVVTTTPPGIEGVKPPPVATPPPTPRR